MRRPERALHRRAACATFYVALLLTTQAWAEDPVDYNRDIVPILAAKCYECHGPDPEQRQAGLRLDTEKSATQVLESGAVAIVAGDANASELLRRINSVDHDERMPPLPAKKQLTGVEKQLLWRWIEQGAGWRAHWSLLPLQRADVPTVRNPTWANNAVDYFILARLEAAGIQPAPAADQYTLIRRAYFDLLGLPPSPSEVREFVTDSSPDAYERLIDRLLASPHYGERWGRHWLDVARYGDSNGGDENHAYPHAYRYRNYVIDAFNQDLPYDRFVHEQVAGDLIQPQGPIKSARQTLAGTGFLAIGTKILAEQDEIKKRADMVDEQIDTLGRALLGLTLGCARCHDHKFDPISTADYYALAGILHSTEVSDRPLLTATYLENKARYDEEIAALSSRRDDIERKLSGELGDAGIIEREAESFDRGNVIVDNDRYGKGIGIISDPGGQKNFAEYDINISVAGSYAVQLRYAAQVARPGRLIVNDQELKSDALNAVTGGWLPEHQKWTIEHICELPQGPIKLRLESEPMMSHIDKLRLIHTADGDVAEYVRALDDIHEEIQAVEQRKPNPQHVMAVAEGDVRNVRIHRRGSHLDLGAEVTRRFPAVLSAADTNVPPNDSGRLELAAWLTDDTWGAGGLASRVIVNRLWHWHFGRGIVDTPDDFGIRGARPTHPHLLGYLASRLIQDNWSIKAVHRLLMTSSVYRMRAVHEDAVALERDPANQLYWRHIPRRLEAEALRDAMLTHAGRMERSLGGAPPTVKSQDPSPQDLAANRATYENSQRRSVYLPVVRTNVYELLTLFDFPNAASPVGRRDETVLPTQALLLLNSPFVVEQAKRISAHLVEESNDQPKVHAGNLYWHLFGRPAAEEEIDDALAFVDKYMQASVEAVAPRQDDSEVRQRAWMALCHALLMSNEFLFVN